MAANSANAAAYQQVRPTQSGMAQDLQFWTQDARATRQEQRMDRQFKADQEKQAYERKKELYDKYIQPYSLTDTGSKSLNGLQAQMLSAAANERFREIEEAKKYEPYSPEWTRHMTRAEILNKAPENIMTMMNFQIQRDQAYKEAKAAGKIWENEKYEKAFQSDYSNIQGGWDENGMPIVSFRDLDGDGILDVESFDDFRDAGGVFQFDVKHDLVGASDAIANRYVAHKKETQEGLWTTETEKVDEQVLKTAIDDLFADQSVLRSALLQFGLDGTETDIQNLKDKFYEDTKAKTINNESKTYDSTTGLGYARLNREGEKPPETVDQPMEPLNVQEDTWGNNWDTLSETGNRSVAPREPIKIETLNVAGGGDLAGATIYAVTIDKNGDVIVDAAIQTSKEETITEGGADRRDRRNNQTGAKPKTQTKKGPTSQRQDYKLTKEEGQRVLATVATQRGTTVEKLKQEITGKSGQGGVMSDEEYEAFLKEAFLKEASGQ